MTNLFVRRSFVSHSGKKLFWKIDCDALTPEDWATLAMIYVESGVGPFGSVVGVPRGGLPFAQALNKYTTRGCSAVLVADDVLTTGGSIVGEMQECGSTRGVVVFDRSGRPLPPGVRALFRVGHHVR